MSAYDQRACEGVCVDTFYPPADDRQATAYAKSICATCPWIDGCLEDAMRVETSGTQQRHGIYGGLSPRQRADLARKQAKDAA